MAWAVTTSGQDRADFVDAESVSAALLASLTGNNATGSFTGVIDVRRWQYLQLRANTATAGRTLTIGVAWYADAAGLITLGSENFIAQNGIDIIDAVPMQGPYMNVGILFDDSGTHDVSCWLVGRTQSPFTGRGWANSTGPGQSIAILGFQAVGAGLSVATTGLFVQSGWATLFLETDNAGAVVTLQFLRSDGTFSNTYAALACVGTVQQRQSQLVAIPSSQIQMRMTNTNAGAINMGCALTMGPTF